MKALGNIFMLMRVAGFVAIGALFLYVEWRFVHGNPVNALNPLVQLYVVGSTIILPLFWGLLALVVVGYIGRRVVRKRMELNLQQGEQP